MTEHEPSIWVK